MAKQNRKSLQKEATPVEKKATVRNEDQTTVADIFEKAGSTAWVILAGLLFLILGFLFRDYLFYTKVYMFKDIACDSYNLSYPALHNITDAINRYGVPKWSFRSGMGQSIFPFMLRDPFEIVLYLAGKGHINFLLGLLEVIKIFLAGVVFYFFLKQLRVSSFASVTGGLMFAFCGFMIEGSGWYGFSYEGLNLALMLLGFELLFSQNKWILFLLASLGVAISMPFNLYVYGLFTAVYAIMRCLQEEMTDIRRVGVLFAKMMGLGMVGLLLAGPFLLENIVQLLESPRGSGTTSLASSLSAMPMFDVPDKFEFGTGVMRLFSNDLMFSGDSFKGWQNILEAPMYYCGLPCLLLMPQVFGILKSRTKWVFGGFLLFWLIPMFFPFFRHAFWLFTGDYYRAYSFFVSVVFILFSVIALDQILKKGRVNLIILVVTVMVLLALINYPYFEDSEFVNGSLKAYVIVMLLLYGVVIFLLGKFGRNLNYRYAFLVLLITEVVYLSGITINERNSVMVSELSEKTGYNDYTNDAVKYIAASDHSFYRIDKAYSSGVARFATINDGMVQEYNGTSSYNPFNQLNYIKFFQLFDVAQKGNELDARWARGLVPKPILETENRVKYMLAKGNNLNPFWRVICDSITTVGDVRIFRNRTVLPFGFVYRNFIRQSAFDRLSSMQKELVSLRTCILNDKDIALTQGLEEFRLRDTFSLGVFAPDTIFNEVARLKSDSLVLGNFNDNHFSGTIQMSGDGLLYLSVPCDDGWQLKVDGKATAKTIVNGGMIGVMLHSGSHKIELDYDLRYWKKGLMMSFLGIVCVAGLWYVPRRKKQRDSVA